MFFEKISNIRQEWWYYFISFILAITTTSFVGYSFYTVRLDVTGEHSFDPEYIVRFGGSTTVFPFAKRAADVYTNNKDEYTAFVVTQSSTGEGINDLFSDNLDIVGATRLPTNKEKLRADASGFEFVITQIAKDAVAVVVHPSKYTAVRALTRAQLNDIFFTGAITDWSQIDPSLSGPIHVYVRDPLLSGTAALFEEKISVSNIRNYVSSAKTVRISPLIVPSISNDPNGIAYTAFEWVDSSVRALAVGETTESAELPVRSSILNGSYFLSRNVYLLERSDSRKQEAIKFVEYMKGQDGKRIANESGLFSE